MSSSNKLLLEESKGISTRADPRCAVCHGIGLKEVWDDNVDAYRQTLCKCVFINQRRAVAELRIRKLFGSNWERQTFATFQTGKNAANEQALEAAKNYVSNFPDFFANGYGIGLSGKARSGKTHLMTATTIALIKRWDVHPFFLSVPRMMRIEKERFSSPSLI